MALIDRSTIRSLAQQRAATIAGVEVRHAGEQVPDEKDKVVIVVESVLLERRERAIDDDADIAELELALRVEIGTEKVKANVYAFESAMGVAVRAFWLGGALTDGETKCEWYGCRDEDLGELDGRAIRAGRIVMRGTCVRGAGDDIDDFLS